MPLIQPGQVLIVVGVLLWLRIDLTDPAIGMNRLTALEGFPCGQVVAVKERVQSDYAVTCKDRILYRVYLMRRGQWWSRRGSSLE
jgi:hypothetical protein